MEIVVESGEEATVFDAGVRCESERAIANNAMAAARPSPNGSQLAGVDWSGARIPAVAMIGPGF